MTPEYYAAHREEVKAQQRDYYWANVETRRSKKRAYAKAHRQEHREELNAAARARKAARPERTRRTQFKSKLKHRYGLTVEQYRDLLVGQAGRCLICHRADRDLVIDHNHSTGQVRGLLCGPCNTVLGLADERADVLARASRYLG